MALLCVHLSVRSFCSLSSRLRGRVPVHTHTGLTVKRDHYVSTQRTTHPNRQPHLFKFPETSLTPRPGPALGPGPGSAPVLHHFHTSAALRVLPAPLIWIVLKPLQKLFAIILGRSIRKWWVALPANRQQLLREAAWRRRWQLAAGAAVAVAIVALLLLTHLDESPLTGRTRLLVFTREKYMELATLTSEAYMEDFAELLVPEDDTRHKVVERVVQHLAQRNKDIPEMSSVSWSVHVVESPNVNAFVLPNGEVFMFTGMLDTVADIHQLTIVLGHEMAHALLGHSAEQVSLSHVVDLLSLILLTAIWAVCPRDSLALLGQWVQGKLVQLMLSRPYSRKLEAEADKVGLQLAAKACADVRAGPVFWQQMEIGDQLRNEPSVPEWLSTHPSHRNRVAQMNRLIPQALELRASCACPALPDTDPRAVFSKTVRLLLDDAIGRGGAEGGGGVKALPHSSTAPAAILPQTMQALSLNADTKGSVPVPVPVPVPASDTATEAGTGATEAKHTPAQGA
ncbi:metalloendopeptidase OMA1, mitochondrial [Genypterus blacodes]|uniref:metalloendopeptidase OMA1, mitochondrial n=1 Tax=Genypterus blacodes TaxID=154954 RepID=UPI003F76C437